MGDHGTVIKDANGAKGQLCKVIRLVEKENDDGERTITEKGLLDEQPTQNIYSNYALVEKKFIKDKNITITLQINSHHICDMLEELTVSYPQRPSLWQPPLQFDAPFQLLFHHHEGLTQREYNGWVEGKSWMNFKIYEQHHFSGTGQVSIDRLPVCPLSCLDKRAIEVKDLMRKRGEVCAGLMRDITASRYYKGRFLAVSDNRDGWELQTTAGRVVIDPQAFNEENPSRQIAVAPWPESSPSEKDILWSPYVHGYNLGTRQWGRFFIEQLGEFEYNQDLWSRVAMNEEQKKLLRSSVGGHCTSPDLYDEGKLKGRGIVVLLHGAPGTGKTLTAGMLPLSLMRDLIEMEADLALFPVALAEDIKKPLLLYPGGELGHRLDTIEGRIKTVVRLASRWGAILLIDEADVFLESRRSGGEVSLERNALIAVFLRQLEYSAGVIFLTSNRASKFDSAIKSRVHLTFRYSFPSLDTRRKIWKDLIKARTVDNVDILKSLEQVAKHAMDGREISNTLNSAIDLAKHKEETFGKKHLDVAIKAWVLCQGEQGSQPGNRALRLLPNMTLQEAILLSMLALIASLAGYIFLFLKDKKLVLVINS
ncbi:hypothetical protein BHE90_000516 [Fusarium euwallaceae]|uniref:AAA+ ATPase domain-containing protein n=1 Tax=Fusarium euwallaceae TaxID=1147111 RepID=A0A430MAD6_9HYPO|nr:hypothetical protein BHE90_000516 [Fusarium euwallaceae]